MQQEIDKGLPKPVYDVPDNRAAKIRRGGVDGPSRGEFSPKVELLPRRASGSSALVLSHDIKVRQHFQSQVQQAGVVAFMPNPESVDVDWCMANATVFDFCLMDDDFLGDTLTTIDLCLRMKKAAPHVPIVMIDGAPEGRDLTAEQMQLCDGRLGPTATSSEFARVVQDAIFRGSMLGGYRETITAPAIPPQPQASMVLDGYDHERLPSAIWLSVAVLLGSATWVGIIASIW